jgi:diguanylate cyclase (GGDEF)-like protein
MYRRNLLNETDRLNALKKLVHDLTETRPGRAVSVLSRDPLTGSFHGLPGDRRFDFPGMDFLDRTDPLIGRLLAGEEWVHRESKHGSHFDDRGTGGTLETVFPIVVNGYIDHVIMIKGENLSDSDCRLIGAYCGQTALNLETLAMHVNLNRKIERLASLVSLVDDLSIEQNYRNLLQTVLDRSTELLLAEQGSIMLIEKETDQLLLEVSKGRRKEQDKRVRVSRGVGIAGGVAASGEPLLVEDIEHDSRVGRRNQEKYKSASFVSVPLKIGHRVVGVMNFNDKRTGELFDDVDLSLAQTCASHAALVLDRKQIYEQTEKLTQQATIDDLTGLLNRGCLLRRLREELARSDRYAKMMSLVMLDIDGFKTINDQFGHARGDLVLRRIAEVMTSTVRSIDIVGRYGGDEFLIILPETDTFFAAHMAERVRSNIEKACISRETTDRIVNKVTSSIGIATFPSHGTSPEVLIANADEALYRAKAGGKNQVVVY